MRQPGSGDAGRFRRPHSLREPSSEAATGTGAAGDPAADPLDGQAAQEPLAAAVTGSPVTAVLERLGLGQLDALIRRRPEVGLGMAFAGGLLAATILKRLGRR